MSLIDFTNIILFTGSRHVNGAYTILLTAKKQILATDSVLNTKIPRKGIWLDFFGKAFVLSSRESHMKHMT